MIIILCDHPSHMELHQTGLGRGQGWDLFYNELRAKGIDRSEVRCLYLTKRVLPDIDYTNATLKKPKAGLQSWKGLFVPTYVQQGWKQIEDVLQDLPVGTAVFCLGDFCLHALTGKFSVSKYRGAYLESFPKKFLVFPSYSPSTVMAMYSLHLAFLRDTRIFLRTFSNPIIGDMDFTYRVLERSDQAIEVISDILKSNESGSLDLTLDLEIFQNKISVFGFSVNGKEAFVIPFCRVTQSQGVYGVKNSFSSEREIAIILLARRLILSASTIRGQNIQFDYQFLFREWLIFPKRGQVILDSMVMAHVLNPTMQKGLDYLASFYLDNYRQWKADKYEVAAGKQFMFAGDEALWKYNAYDVIMTHRLVDALKIHLFEAELSHVYRSQMLSICPLLRMMCGGMKIDEQERARILGDIESRLTQYKHYIKKVTGRELNPESPKQLNEYFYGELKLPPQLHPKRKTVTTDYEALSKLASLEPICRPLIARINAIRSLSGLHAMANMSLSENGRAHCTYNPAGTDTYRLSSSESALGEGTNQQNITKGDEHPKMTFDWAPNLRRMYVPDDGFVLFEGDLAGADFQVVVWEAGCDRLKKALLDKVDTHLFNADTIYDLKLPYEILKKSHPNHEIIKERYDKQRQLAKAGVHATNYDVSPRTLAATMGISVRAAEQFQSKWFQDNPEIKLWQLEKKRQLSLTRSVRNGFGYRYYWSDRVDYHAEKAVLAWSPQSTVAIVTQKIMVAIDKLPFEDVRINLQVHDSLLFQIRREKVDHYLPIIKELSKIVIPYPDDPLIIPFEIKEMKNWGEKHVKTSTG